MPVLRKAHFNWLKSYKTSDRCSLKKKIHLILWSKDHENQASRMSYSENISSSCPPCWCFNTALTLYMQKPVITICMYCYPAKKNLKRKTLCRIGVKQKQFLLQLKNHHWNRDAIKLATKIIIVIPSNIE